MVLLQGCFAVKRLVPTLVCVLSSHIQFIILITVLRGVPVSAGIPKWNNLYSRQQPFPQLNPSVRSHFPQSPFKHLPVIKINKKINTRIQFLWGQSKIGFSNLIRFFRHLSFTVWAKFNSTFLCFTINSVILVVFINILN